MWLNKLFNTSFNFRAPKHCTEDSVQEVLFPVCDVRTVDLAAAVAVQQMVSVIDLGTLSANGTLNLAIDAQVSKGAVLRIKAASDGTGRSVTLGTGLEGPAMGGTANKTKVQSFLYDGSVFSPMGAPLQLD